MAKTTTKNITKIILLSLVAAGAAGAVVALPGLAILGKEFASWNKYKKFRLKSTLKRLHKQRMINFSEKSDGTIQLELIEAGNKRILQYKFEEMEIKTPLKWDGLWRLVMFDIPDKKKQAREALRAKLKTLGFYKIQESIFIHPYDCKNEIDFIKELYSIGPFVKFVIAGNIDDDFKLRKIFLLN
ncbi:CRISPR-associated endonuclease Cas2 [Patescibacteria group bacterium]|nr:CRISPR-associated endonuclease Cas2 [Patescibacteria group bacterium]MBU4338930.1 CRISPR-associated endonuclease Cas2 [Patescibacteria group bacterium]